MIIREAAASKAKRVSKLTRDSSQPPYKAAYFHHRNKRSWELSSHLLLKCIRHSSAVCSAARKIQLLIRT